VADDLSTASIAPRGVDLVAGKAGVFNRGVSTPAATTITNAGTSVTPGIELGGLGTLRLDFVTAAIAGSATTITPTVQTSMDNGVNDAWRTVAAFSAVTANGTVTKTFPGLDRWVRASILFAGTAGQTATVSLSGEAC
jgi:hypothetical protein